MSEDNLYKQCADVLSLCQKMKDDLAALLDPESGFAPRLRELCQRRIEDAEDIETRAPLALEELEALRMESDTWSLLQAVMPVRKTAPEPLPTTRDLLAENPYTPTSALAQSIMQASALLSELVVVREWLHDTAPPPPPGEATAGYWRFTRHRLAQAMRTGSQRDQEGLVRFLDPDAGNREEGRSLAGDDMSYEKSLAQSLYLYIRAGRLEEAMELCRKAHQPWRSASIRGSLLFEWRAITTGMPEMETEDDFDGWRGNRRRRLWKTTCTRAALNPSLPDQERALYAALVPTPQTSAVLKTACRTWEDHLWAQISVLCEEKQALELNKLGGGFWEEEELEREGIKGGGGREDEEWERDVSTTLLALSGIEVLEGPPGDHPFHISQLHIILDRTDALLDNFADGLKTGKHTPAAIDYPYMTRFFAHLCLFLRMIDIPVSPDAAQVILEAYLRVLEDAGQRDLIAMYAGALGDNAIQRYAAFLVSLELSADIDERRAALARAQAHGLDVTLVAIATAERTMEKVFKTLPPLLKGPLPSLAPQSLLRAPSDEEMLLLRSLEWTTFQEATYDTALEQANVILRYFIGAGRVHVAKHVLDRLPDELASIGVPEDRATEFLHYGQFFIVQEAFDRVVALQALEYQPMHREAHIKWSETYRDALDYAREQVVKLLTSDWLVSDVSQGGDRRRRELIRIRQIYIPDFIVRLHVMLVNSRHRYRRNLKHAVELANVVADSRYKLYDDFTDNEGKRLTDYLGVVREAVLAGLEEGGSDPFKIVISP
ncbi:hypothetical protein GLOTRDRAFT_78934 [Gloeophyllum trabeum ATCC 11539]|uniref:Nuclear pore complex protein n=1 Tax=Gloeophyllum trabeum (strain ATCC 11539 / FP-39264 / Madison 617) TaxID=670483 RepID=S7PZL8_GLOTA|nr:uncharacterized protein GLOTRDRAFT_78934 [Gloeophyllum trabeum ATCC 11539]EPQ52913.1 hypothetical protein GLOTRDRAFT_78934 [Gloeophyllum trabeum ATCC 11539]